VVGVQIQARVNNAVVWSALDPDVSPDWTTLDPDVSPDWTTIAA